MYILNIRFEWDADKAARNAAKHGITFEAAATAFEHEAGVLDSDEVHSTFWEKRYQLVGQMHSTLLRAGKPLIIVVFTIRPGNSYRLISARQANEEERKRYDQHQRQSKEK